MQHRRLPSLDNRTELADTAPPRFLVKLYYVLAARRIRKTRNGSRLIELLVSLPSRHLGDVLPALESAKEKAKREMQGIKASVDGCRVAASMRRQ